jgi:2-dehydro-3-deoxyphosphogluconate aldolase/(4S)-4-hydroxy-2-oxoglutarate aldolase
MTIPEFKVDKFLQIPIVGIVRNISLDDLKVILPIYERAGLTTIEITLNTPQAAQLIRYAKDHFGTNLNVGAGTICDLQDLEVALDAGASFIVTPILDPEVIKRCVQLRIPVFPGAYTPTEIYTAWKLGATMVKIYPATALGSVYIKELKAPLNGLKVLPTGGVGLSNMAEFFQCGADGVGIGGQLFDQKLISAQDWVALEVHFRAFVSKLNKPTTLSE